MGNVQNLRREWMQQWKNLSLDLVVAPGFGRQAVKHGLSETVSLAAAYAFVWNVLDLPAVAMPVTRVQADEQVY